MMRDHLKVITSINESLSRNGVGNLMSLCLSGSHSYGWNTPLSDIDYRGIFVGDINRLLGLDKPKDTFELTLQDYVKGDKKEIVLFELQKAINLILQGNSNVLEWFSSETVYTTADYLKLRKLARNNITKRTYNAYRGMASYNYKKFILQGRKSVKKYLYIVRALMAGIYTLETGKIEPNVRALHIALGRPFGIPNLLNHKQQNTELDEVEKQVIEKTISEYFHQLDRAYENSKLPEEPDREAFNKFLLGIRRGS